MVALRFLVPSVGVQIPVSLPLLRTFRFLRSVFFFEKSSATWLFNLLKDLTVLLETFLEILNGFESSRLFVCARHC
jgi:hypothetical protein